MAGKIIGLLRKIVNATGAKIVVSSSWRDLGMEKLRKAWSENNKPGELIDTTPIWVLTTVDAIRQWLKDNHCGHFAVLDDSKLEVPNLLKTNPYIGLTEEEVEKIIKVLLPK